MKLNLHLKAKIIQVLIQLNYLLLSIRCAVNCLWTCLQIIMLISYWHILYHSQYRLSFITSVN